MGLSLVTITLSAYGYHQCGDRVDRHLYIVIPTYAEGIYKLNHGSTS